jgi:toxin secretion/phage lysis holin
VSERYWWSTVVGTVAAAWALVMHIPAVLLILVALMAVDAVLELLVQAARGKKRYDRFYRGLIRSAGTLLLLAALGASETVLGFDAMDYSAVFFIVSQLLSITEKAALLGVPIPERVKRLLLILREEHDEQQDRAQAQPNTTNPR